MPEVPFNIDKVSDVCQERSCHGKAFTIITVSEGAKPIGGDVVVSQIVKDSPDPIRLGGVSQVVADQIAAKTGLETRTTILGHVQRGGTPCAYDRVLATIFGHAALELAVQGQWNRMVAMQKGRIVSVPIEEVAHRQRLVPMDHPLVAGRQGCGHFARRLKSAVAGSRLPVSWVCKAGLRGSFSVGCHGRTPT